MDMLSNPNTYHHYGKYLVVTGTSIVRFESKYNNLSCVLMLINVLQLGLIDKCTC